MNALNQTPKPKAGAPIKLNYQAKSPELAALLVGHWFTDLPNFSAFLFHEIPDLNWAGFYFSDTTRLILGPFMGKPACTEIDFARGVCGASFTRQEPLIVADVHAYPGHIACDANSNSEMVLPVIQHERCVGVLDLDSPSLLRFSEEDLCGVQSWLDLLVLKTDLRALVATLEKQPPSR
ncbi:MAG: GAF domain-containing protein [Bdellovibrio sp.]